jgi:zinc protease
LNDLSISLSFSASRDDFSGHVKTLSKNKSEAFKLLTLALTSPRFDEEAVNRMRLANLTRIRSDMNDPDWMAARLLNDTVFNGHPYAMNSGGTLTSLTRITGDDLRAKFRNELTRDRLVISAAGDISESELSAALDEIFGKLPEKQTAIPVGTATLPSAASIILYSKDIPQTVMQMAIPGIDQKDPDYFAAEVMNFIFGGAGFGSRLMDTVREQRGLTYGIYSGLNEMDHADTFNISTSTRNETVKDIIGLTRQEMDKLRQTPVTPQEIRNARTYLIGSVPLDLTSTDRISAYMLAFQSEGLPKNYLDIREEKLKTVSDKDVARVAARLLDPQKMTIVLIGKPAGVSPTRTVTTLPNVE